MFCTLSNVLDPGIVDKYKLLLFQDGDIILCENFMVYVRP
jgi:hypothetical protein